MVSVRTPQGSLLVAAPTTRKALLEAPSADLLLNFTAGSFVSVATPEHFNATPARNPPAEPSGRELLGLLTVPPPAF